MLRGEKTKIKNILLFKHDILQKTIIKDILFVCKKHVINMKQACKTKKEKKKQLVTFRF